MQILLNPSYQPIPWLLKKFFAPSWPSRAACSYIINRVLTVAKAAIGHPPVVIGLPEPRIDLDSPVKICNRVSVIAEAAIGHPPVVIGLPIPGLISIALL